MEDRGHGLVRRWVVDNKRQMCTLHAALCVITQRSAMNVTIMNFEKRMDRVWMQVLLYVRVFGFGVVLLQVFAVDHRMLIPLVVAINSTLFHSRNPDRIHIHIMLPRYISGMISVNLGLAGTNHHRTIDAQTLQSLLGNFFPHARWQHILKSQFLNLDITWFECIISIHANKLQFMANQS